MNQNAPSRFDVLLIEDDTDQAQWIKDHMQNQAIKMRVHHVLDGEEALNYLLHKDKFVSPQTSPQPHLILLDLRLPKYDGLEVLEKIRALPHALEIPIIILSASQSDRDMQKAYQLHANSYLVKPLNDDEFETLLIHLCQYWLRWNHTPYSTSTKPI